MQQRSMMRISALVVSAAAVWMPASAQAPLAAPSRAPTIKVGGRAPEFSLASSDGRTYRLGELKGKRSLVLVIFRGVW